MKSKDLDSEILIEKSKYLKELLGFDYCDFRIKLLTNEIKFKTYKKKINAANF